MKKYKGSPRNWGDLDDEEKEELAQEYSEATANELAEKYNLRLSAIRNSLSRANKKAEHGGAGRGAETKRARSGSAGSAASKPPRKTNARANKTNNANSKHRRLASHLGWPVRQLSRRGIRNGLLGNAGKDKARIN